MLKHNFLKIITFILISSLFFSPSVSANMQAMSEDDLTRIDAENGITIALNTDVYLQATRVGLYTTTSPYTSGIVLQNLLIDNSTTGGTYATPKAFNINSTVLLDVGTTSGRTWLNISGENIYNPIGITIGTGVYTANTGVWIEDGANDRTLGDLQIRGLFMGRDLSGTTGGATRTTGYNPPGNIYHFTMGESPFIRLSGHGGTSNGIDLFASMNLYVDSLTFINGSTANNRMTVSGIYFCSSSGGNPQTPSNWTPTGNLSMGIYDPPLYSGTADYPVTIDVGTSGAETYLNLNLPMSGTVRINEFKMDNGNDWGPIAIDGMVMKMVNVRLSNL